MSMMIHMNITKMVTGNILKLVIPLNKIEVDDTSTPTLPKTNMDTQNDGLEKVTPFESGNFWYLC